MHHVAAKYVMMFLNEIKELYSEQPDLAFEKAKQMQEKYINNKHLQVGCRKKRRKKKKERTRERRKKERKKKERRRKKKNEEHGDGNG